MTIRQAFVQLHLAIFLAGFTGIFGKLIELNEGLLVWYRMLITAVTMWVVYGIMGKLRKISHADKFRLTGIGFLVALHWVGFYGSIKYANISVALVCFSSIGFFTALLEPLILKRKINWTELFLGLLVIAGIYIIFRFDPQYKIGIVLGIISSILIAIAIILIGIVVQRVPSHTLLAWQLTGGFLALSLFMPVYLNLFPVSTILPSAMDWFWLLLLAWFCSVLAFQFSVNALKKLSAFTVNLSYNLEPVYGILLAFLIYKENTMLSKWFYIGFSLIAISLLAHFIMVLKREKKLLANAGTD